MMGMAAIVGAAKTAAASEAVQQFGMEALRRVGTGIYQRIFAPDPIASLDPDIAADPVAAIQAKLDSLVEASATRQEMADAFSALQSELANAAARAEAAAHRRTTVILALLALNGVATLGVLFLQLF